MRLSYQSIICFQLVVSSLYCCEGCVDEERRLLLQIKDTAGDRKRLYPLSVWMGENCCEWPGVSCRTSSNSSTHVVSIDLTWGAEDLLLLSPGRTAKLLSPQVARTAVDGNRLSPKIARTAVEGLATWYPNASLFARFEHLESLSLSYIGGWWIQPRGLCAMRNLKSLDLSDNNLDNKDIPLCLLTSSSKLEELRLDGNKVRSLDGFAEIKSLRKLSLWGNGLNESIDSLSGLCGMGKLKILVLSENNLDDEHIPSCLLTNSSKLEGLNLGYNNLRSFDGFAQMKSLKMLYLQRNSLNGNVNSLSRLCGMKNLKSLDLSKNNLDDREIGPCNLSTHSSKLEELNLDGNNLRSLDGLAQMKSLKTLYLVRNSLNESINSLYGLCGMKNLKSLDLSYNNLDGTEIGPCNLSAYSSKLEELTLEGNNLQSLDGFAQMKSLRMLRARNNSLNNSIDLLSTLKHMSNLQELDLDENQLTDRNLCSWISNLTSIASLSLSSNNLQDPVTLKGLCSLRNLHQLKLYNNSIEGQIPTCFKDMYSLQELDLSYNLFNGSIPPSIFSNLTMITAFYVENNQLNGVIPFFMFANCSKLSFIHLSNNPQAKVETEHPRWTPTFQLLALFLTRCNVSNGIPSFLSSQRCLQYFESDYSFLEGPIPPWLLYNVTAPLLLSLRGNRLDGPFPESSQVNPSMLMRLDISNNYIYGTLPMNIGELLPMLVHLNASKNALQGNIPSSMDGLVTLETLDLSKNKLSGEMPLGLNGHNTSLRFLILSKNHLEGQIFARDFHATELIIMVLHSNYFNGTIPWSLSNSQSLMFFDVRHNLLAGPIPSWLSSLPSLVSILLGGNNFTGHIPLNFCQMQSLHTLDLSNNQLSGSISSCFNNITSLVKKSSIFELVDGRIARPYETITMDRLGVAVGIHLTMDFTTKGSVYTYEGMPLYLMTGLDLSMNRLTGSIPLQLGKLKELHALNLSNNLLIGLIPESFKGLANIESLDLSHNKLIGPIPFELVQLTFLTTFRVAFNNLSGKIPSGGQFNTFNASNYAGNLDLCGSPIERNCSSDDPPQPHDKEEDTEESDIFSRPIIFYLWVVFSFALGFSSFALILIFNANWRWKYFKITDEYINLAVKGIRKLPIVRKCL